MTTVKELRDALAQLGAGHDNREVLVWLPGTRIRLRPVLIVGDKRGVMIEGNVIEGELP